jgi:hypothetical protein
MKNEILELDLNRSGAIIVHCDDETIRTIKDHIKTTFETNIPIQIIFENTKLTYEFTTNKIKITTIFP